MRVCHIVPSLEERHGGPSKSVRALANAQAALGEQVEVLSTLEPGQPPPVAGPDAARLITFPREAPLRFCPSRPLAAHLESGQYDCLHHHAVWLLTLRYARNAARKRSLPLVISPRGMFSPWAMAHHRWRKWLAGQLIHPGAFSSAAGWHATSQEEADDISRLGWNQPVCVAPNGVEIPDAAALTSARTAWLTICPELAGRRVALFYSRFHRKKRVRELLDLWLAEPRGDWLLLLVGVPEEYSIAEINAWITRADAGDRVRVFDGGATPPPYAAASLFVLPTHSENFGLVIAEALAAGVPALVTDTTPWRGLDENEAGRCVSWEAYAGALRTLLSESDDTLRQRGDRGRAWVTRDFTWAGSARLLSAFHRHLIEA